MFRLVSIVVLALAALAAAVHYLAFGPRPRQAAGAKREVRRFSLWVVVVHGVLLLSFVVLAATGGAAAAMGKPLRGWLLFAHCAAAPLFSAALTLTTLAWLGACLFEEHDWVWAKHLGGYLGGRQDLPAGRFNAGQKAFFWGIAALGLVGVLSGLGRIVPVLGAAGQAALYDVHRAVALLLLVVFLVHCYLATIANPGTLLAMVCGRVSADWAAYHHPLWRQRVKGQKGEQSDE